MSTGEPYQTPSKTPSEKEHQCKDNLEAILFLKFCIQNKLNEILRQLFFGGGSRQQKL